MRAVAAGPSWKSAFSVAVKKKRPLFGTPALSKARLFRMPLVWVAAHERIDGWARVRVALGGEDELPVLGQHETLRVDRARRVRLAVGCQQCRHGVEMDVPVGQGPVGDVQAHGVEASLPADASGIVGDDVIAVQHRVVRDRRETADRRPAERRPRRQDRLAAIVEAERRALSDRRRRRGQPRREHAECRCE